MKALYYIATNGLGRVVHFNNGFMKVVDQYTDVEVKKIDFPGDFPENFTMHTCLRYAYDAISGTLTESVFVPSANEHTMRIYLLMSRYTALHCLDCESKDLIYTSPDPDIKQRMLDAQAYWYPRLTESESVNDLCDMCYYLSREKLAEFDKNNTTIYETFEDQRGI